MIGPIMDVWVNNVVILGIGDVRRVKDARCIEISKMAEMGPFGAHITGLACNGNIEGIEGKTDAAILRNNMLSVLLDPPRL